MAWGFFLNMDRLSLDIAREHVVNMTNDNMHNDLWIDNDKLINNLKNGFIVITHLNTFLESFSNSILTNCIKCNDETLLKGNIEKKLEFIFVHYNKEIKKIKSNYSWQIYKTTTKVRNELIHFKKTFIGDGSWIPDFSLANILVKDFFIKDNINKIIEEYINLGDLIANELGLDVFHNIDIFETDARDGLASYVYDKNMIDIDEERFKE